MAEQIFKSHLPENVLMTPEILEKLFCGLRRQTWNFSESVHPSTFSEKLTAIQRQNITMILVV